MRPGDVYAVQHRGKPRPVVVVSREELNRGDYVVIIPFTSQRFDVRRALQNCVPFRAGEFGFDRDCVAQAEAIQQIERSLLLGDTPLFTLDEAAVARLGRAVGNVISCRCEPLG